MREIKFRVWTGTDMIYPDTLHHLANAHFWNIKLTDKPTIKASLARKYSIMQFTGLQDKNGKEIYEGDIVKLKETKLQMLWDEDGWGLKELSRNNWWYGFQQFQNCEIIGNIYENPELLP